VRALDDAAARVEDAGGSANRVVDRLASGWGKLSDEEKQELAELVIAIGGAVSMAVAAYRKSGKSKKKKARKEVSKVGSKVLKKLASADVESKVKKVAKKAKKKAKKK
jgi:hypothetical protein